MLRGIIQLTTEEVLEIEKAINSKSFADTPLGSKLSYINKEYQAINNIEVSEEDLEQLLDEIMPVEPSNKTLFFAMEKVGNLLRQLRSSNI